jgi:alpha-tubulin suppressor-like RCC1 family protein
MPVLFDGSFKEVVASTSHTCGLSQAGKVFCWGFNGYGVLGIGTVDDTYPGESNPEPVEVQAEKRFTALFSGGAHTCALTNDGDAYCWGANWGGGLGDGTTENRSLPTLVSTTERFETLSLGSHTCGLTPADEVWCWGQNSDGQVGIGSRATTLLPQKVSTTEKFSQVSAGGSHTCATTPAGALFCWGSNERGQIGDGGSSLGWTFPVLAWRW